MNEPDNFALVPRPPGALEKAAPGAKRILSGIVSDTLTLAKKESPQKPTFTALLGKDHFADMMELWLEWKLGATNSLRFFYFSRSSELIKLAGEHSFDLVFMYVGNINWDTGSGDGFGDRAVRVLGELKARYGKPIVATQGMDLSAEFEPRGVIFLNAPFVLEDLWARLQPQLVASVGSKDTVKFHRNAGQGDQTDKTRPLRIILMDENSFPVKFMEFFIKQSFPNVVLQTFQDRSEGLQELPSLNPDLLIVEIVNAGKLDFEALQSLADRKVTYPIIVTSGLEESRRAVTAYANKGLNITFLPKPFTVENFIRTLESSLKISRDAIEKPSETKPQPHRTRPPRIVVVDDEEWFVDMVGLLIRSWFTDVTLLTFTSKAEALGDLSAEVPDLLMLGMVPLGREILPLLAERNVQYPILATSGYEPEADVRRKAGPKLKLSFIAKPFSMDELHHHLHTHFASAREFRGQVHKDTT